MSDNVKQDFWAKDPCILVTDPQFIPSREMSKNEKLNTLTRLVVLITVAMYMLDYDMWLTFLLASMVILLLIKFSNDRSEVKKEKEGFTVTPTYNSLNFEQTSVAPLFSEEWQIYPTTYDLYTNVPEPVDFYEPLKPQSYPYGQYLTTTNLMPVDEYNVRMMNGGTADAREYANSAFTRNTIAFRDNMSRIVKKSMARRYRNSNLNDTFSPFTSY